MLKKAVIKIKSFFLPCYQNSFHPYLLRKSALIVYILVVFVGNFLTGFGAGGVTASSITTSNLVELTNEERISAGLAPLNSDSRLVSAAYEKAENIFELQYWSHYGPNGETPWQFIRGSGYDYVYAGENLAKGFNSSEAVISAWMASKTHRENILGANYDDIGIAVVPGNLHGDDVILVVQMFGSLDVDAGDSGNDTVSNLQELPGGDEIELSIEHPEDGDILANSDVAIKGVASDDFGEISIYENDENLGSVVPESNSWEFKPTTRWEEGAHNIIAKGDVKNLDDRVSFEIDTIPPRIDGNTLKVESVGGVMDKVRISVRLNEDPERIYVSIGSISEEMKKSGGEYVAELPEVEVLLGGEIRIFAYDEIDNYSVLDISDNVLGVADTQAKVKSKFLGFINIEDKSGLFNRAMILLIAFLLVIDGVYLYKMNILQTRGKTLFPFAVWIVIMGIGMIVGSRGSIY